MQIARGAPRLPAAFDLGAAELAAGQLRGFADLVAERMDVAEMPAAAMQLDRFADLVAHGV